MHRRSTAAASWEELIPSSFERTLYIQDLKIAIPAGSFILYRTGEKNKNGSNDAPEGCQLSREQQNQQELKSAVGRIIEVLDSVPDDLLALPQEPDVLLPVQYAKVNVFEDYSLISDKLFLNEAESSAALNGRRAWQRLVQLCTYKWIPSSDVVGLSFVFLEEDTTFVDECCGMFNAYLLKHRIDSSGQISSISRDLCPPFPSCLESFRRQWSVDHCHMIFNSIRQIRQDMQKSLCRVAQSQGDFTVKTTKLLLPNCSWFYIKSNLACRGINSIPAVRYTVPKSILSWGLTLHSCPYIGSFDVIRFDTKEKMDAFRQLFGMMAGFGVRKRRPRYMEGKSVLSINDVLNIISCRSLTEDNTNDNSNQSESVNYHCFKQLGMTDDGIDLAYDSSEGVLQIVLRYRKLIVTNTSLSSLVSVGVAKREEAAACSDSTQVVDMNEITPGMEFIDNEYIMQIQKVFTNELHAKRVYKIVDNDTTTTTMKVYSSEIVIYTDVTDVHQKIQQMLE